MSRYTPRRRLAQAGPMSPHRASVLWGGVLDQAIRLAGGGAAICAPLDLAGALRRLPPFPLETGDLRGRFAEAWKAWAMAWAALTDAELRGAYAGPVLEGARVLDRLLTEVRTARAQAWLGQQRDD